MTGILTEADLTSGARRLAEAEDALVPVPNRLLDLTQVESIAFGFPEVLALATHRRNRTFANDIKSGIVVASEVQRGFARMYQTLVDHPRIHLEIFDDRTAAEAWLRAPL